MKKLKFKIVKMLEWIDDKIIGHRSLLFCWFITVKLESWWIDE